MSYHSLSRAITTNHALSLVILSYHPSYNQDFSELFRILWTSSLSRAITQSLPYHFVSLTITNLITKSFFRTLKSPHPFEFILWWRHSLSRAITQILPYHLLSLAITHLITNIFQNSKITHPFEFILWFIPYPVLSRQSLLMNSSPYQPYNQEFFQTFDVVSFLIPCYHHKSCLITCYP